MESEQRGRASRASSTSSLGREVRCGCQYYQSDSLLPERRALQARPPSRTMQQPPPVRCSEHEYEPIGAPHSVPQLHTVTMTTTAPVVRITDTDVVQVGDSDDSIDDRTRLPPELTKEGDVILPLDGKIEDSAMEGQELVEVGDTSEELESPQEFQDRIEERFLNAATPGTESRTDAEVNTSQVDSLALEELPLRRGARGLPQRIRSQAGKLRSRIRSIQRPTFAFVSKPKADKSRSTSSNKSERSRAEKRPSRMDRIRSSFSERPRFSLPSRPKFHLPDRSKFHLPDRSKIHLPERPKFNIKKPNIRLPSAFARIGHLGTREPDERSSESKAGSRRNIFDFSTYPRIFDKGAKSRSSEYTTSTPKDSRAQSVETSTFPRGGRGRPKANGRWNQEYEEDVFAADDTTAVERSHPWRHPSLEEPRLSIRMEAEVLAAVRAIPWEEKRRQEQEEELQYMDYEQETEESEGKPVERLPDNKEVEEDYQVEQVELEPTSYTVAVEQRVIEGSADPRILPRSRSLDNPVSHLHEDESFEESFARTGRRRGYARRKISSEEEYEEDMDADEEREPSSVHSDREQQQSSGSSCERRRRGVIEEIDSDEFFLRESGLSQDDMTLGKYLTSQIRDALRAEINNALADDDQELRLPPRRPMRSRSMSKRKEDSIDSYQVAPPARPKRDRGRRQQSTESGDDVSRERRSESRHRIVYQAQGSQDVPTMEPLDDIVIVKPIRRKSKSSLRSHSQIPTDSSSLFGSIPARPPSPRGVSAPPVVPTRRKRSRQEVHPEHRNGDVKEICNGHTEWKVDPIDPTDPPMEVLDTEGAFTTDEPMPTHQDIRRMLRDLVEPPVPPKRRSRSRGTSVAQDEDRTSHGAESLPDVEYSEDVIPRDSDLGSIDLPPGYAVIEKREKPPRPPPPRRRKGKFATLPKPVTPKRPQRAYSTLRPSKTKDSTSLSESLDGLGPAESSAYIEIESDKKMFKNGEVLEKIQGRPLPPPPRPPRARKSDRSEYESRSYREMTTEESTIATQTDPLPDDMIIEEEVTQAKLVVAPSSSGSQILVSTERIPSPIAGPPLVPALPTSQRIRSELGYDTVSLKSSSPIRDCEDLDERPHLSAPHLGHQVDSEETRRRILRSALQADETLRIANLEVGDLRVDRLSVSHIETSKIVASEVDALVVTASELRGMSSMEERISPSIINELIAIKHHLEAAVAASSLARERSPKPLEDIPSSSSRTRLAPEPADGEQRSLNSGEESCVKGDEKVVNTEVNDRLPITRTLALIQVEDEVGTITPTQTLSVSQSDKVIEPRLHSPPVTEESLRILDSESTLSLNTDAAQKSLLPGEPQSLTSSTLEESRRVPTNPVISEGTESDINKRSEPERKPRETSSDSGKDSSRKSRSRSPSPITCSRQTASPVRSLPPAISVTPDTPDASQVQRSTSTEVQPQRAVISYSSREDVAIDALRESSQSPVPASLPPGATHFIAFPVSQMPGALISRDETQGEHDPSISDTTYQLIRALRLAGIRATRYFVEYLASVRGGEETREKIREVEVTLCALLLLVAALLVYFFTSPRTVTHHHHWDYYNPPQ